MDGPHYESSVWRILERPMAVRVELQRVAPALVHGPPIEAISPVVASTGLRIGEPSPIGTLHAWIRTYRGLWIGRCVVEARIGQSHNVLLDLYAPADAIRPESNPTGPPGTQMAVNSGFSSYYYDFGAAGLGTLKSCPGGMVAYVGEGGRIRCGSKYESGQ